MAYSLRPALTRYEVVEKGKMITWSRHVLLRATGESFLLEQKGRVRYGGYDYGSMDLSLGACWHMHLMDAFSLGRRLGALLIDAHDLISGSWIICMQTSINRRMSYGRGKVDRKRLVLKAPRIHGCREAQGGGGDSWSHREGRPSRRRLEASASAT